MECGLSKKKLNEILGVIWRSLLCGVAIGFVITFFILGAEEIMSITKEIYILCGRAWWSICLLFVTLIIIAFLINFIFSFAPHINGNYTQKRGVVERATDFNWFITGMAYLLSSYLSFFAGLPLGSERPAAFLGSTFAEGISDYLKSDKKAAFRVIGESAGVTVAVKAPLTGIIYALEEAGKKRKGFKITLSLIIGTIISSVAAYFVSYMLIALLFKKDFSLYDNVIFTGVSMKYIIYLLILGIVIGVMAGIFFMLAKVGQTQFRRVKLKPFWLLCVAVIITGIVGLINKDEFKGNLLLGGGSNLIFSGIDMEFSLGIFIAYFAIKFVLVIICVCSGATGGLFIPSMALGAMTGGIMCRLFEMWGNIPNEIIPAMIIISSAAFMGCFMHLPFTSFFLCIELSGLSIFSSHFSLEIIFAAIVVIVISYSVSMLFEIKSIRGMSKLNRVIKAKK